jgi:hypothetical protein
MPGALHFYDHHRQRYAAKVPIPEAGEFMIGDYTGEGTVGRDGELRITLVELDGDRRWSLYPYLEVFGEGDRPRGSTMVADLIPSGVSGKSEDSDGFPAGPTARFGRVRKAVDSGA